MPDKMYAYKCPCGTVATSAERSPIPRVESDTGMTMVLTHHGGIIWLCPACYAKAKAAAKLLIDICGGDKDVYLPNFVRGPVG